MSAINWPRFILAILLAPLVPGILFLAFSMFGYPGEGAWSLKFAAMLGYPAMVVLGAPAHLILMKCRWTAWWCYALTGLLIGAIICGLLFGVRVAALGAILGALTAAVFWLIAKPPRALVA